MSYFIRKSNTFFVTDSSDIHSKLPTGNYSVRESELAGIYLESVNSFSLPDRLYGTIVQDATRIFHTFQSRTGSTGVLLVGEKGSGKTLLAKQLSVLCAQAGFPTITVNECFQGDSFNKLIQAIDTEALILFDEFEKVYLDEEHDQNTILTLLDGVYPTKKLFVLTCNNKWAINNHLWNRPGRLFYSLDFEGLDENFITEYCGINLKHRHRLDQVMMVARMFSSINFDMLQSLVEETNRYDEDPMKLLRMLNLKFEFDDDADYSIGLKLQGHSLSSDLLATKSWVGNPLRLRAKDSILVRMRVPMVAFRNERIDIAALESFSRKHPYRVMDSGENYSDFDPVVEGYDGGFRELYWSFLAGDLASCDKNGVIFRDKEGRELILTRQEKSSRWNRRPF